MISDTKQDDEVLDEKNDYDAVEEADTSLKENIVMVFDDLTIPEEINTTEIKEL